MKATGWNGNVRAIATGFAFFVAAYVSFAFTRFGGGAAYLWIADAVLLASLATTPRRRWGSILVACLVGHLAAAAACGLLRPIAFPVAAISVGEGLGAAILMTRLRARDAMQDAIRQLLIFVAVAGVIAPALAAIPGAWFISLYTPDSYVSNWTAWYTGHALGTLTFVPVLTLIFSGEAGRWLAGASAARRIETGALVLLVAAVALLVFCQDRLPLLFLPILPVMLATFRAGRLGAAASIVVIALIGGWFTARGNGPAIMMAGGPAAHLRFFQFYMAITVLTALPAAAELRRQRAVFKHLRESEARYRLLADNSTDIVLSADRHGLVTYASPSASQIIGRPAETMVGHSAVLPVHPDDRPLVADAHHRLARGTEDTMWVEYRVQTTDGSERWFESHARAVRDGDGAFSGTVSAIRDVTQRKVLEQELALAAATDPLTGLPNRRVFDAALERLVESGQAGCVAIFDLDHFKSINDRFGHDGGDRVLNAFAATARRLVRDDDVVARLGGEEFGILLPGATRDQATAVCERLRAAVGAQPVPLGEETARVTASAGLAATRPGIDAGELLRAADAALYRAKADGRDRLRLAA